MGIDAVVEVFHDVLALPAEIEHLAYTGMYGAVAHHKDHIALVEFQFGDEDPFFEDGHLGAGKVAGMAMVVPDGLRVVELEEVSSPLVVDMYNRECAVCHSAFLADGERLYDGAYTVLYVGAASHHGA